MKKILFLSIIYLIPFSVMSQKVTIQVIKVENAAVSDWKILDEQYRILYSGNEYQYNDSVSFSLEGNKHYIMSITINEIYNHDTSLYSLRLNGEPIILIPSNTEPGDHFYPFFTGIKAEEVKITGGTGTTISSFPWQVYYESGDYTCGGSIISENWIITAAHCTQNDDGSAIAASDMSVTVGANNPRNTLEGTKYKISEVIVHKDYNNNTLENDIALLKLAEPLNFENAKPIKILLSEDVADGASDPGVMSWVTGWGLTGVHPSTYPTTLQKVQLPIITNAQAASVWNSIPATDIMAGYLSGNKDACSGDSGGPLVVPVSDEYKLAGLVSWGSSNCNTYGGYTRVSLFETWIRSKTGIEKEYIPASPVGDTILCQGVDANQYSVAKVPGASVYEWKLLPAIAGSIYVNSEIATVIWDTSYTGSVTVKLRVTINNKVSEWSKLNINIFKNTKLLSQSGDSVICARQPINLKVEAEGYSLNYKWYHNGNLTQSGSSGELNITNALTDASGKYFCEITGVCGIKKSGNINLTVHPLTSISYISPVTEIPFGDDITLEIRAEGYDLFYQWQRDDVLLENNNSPQLVLQDVNANNTGLYRTNVTGACGIKLSEGTYLYVKKENYSGEPEVFLWPTIAHDEFKVALSNDQYYNICLFSTSGRLLSEQFNCRYQTTINVNKIPEGFYIVTVYNNNFRKSLKVIKR
jgi:secreted trypsin-like serine protease